MILINGNLLADSVLEKARKELQERSLKPVLAIIFIGNDAGSRVYVRKKQEAGARIGVRVDLHHFDTATTKEIVALTAELAADKAVHGIILQLPAPGIDIKKVLALIPENKDVDGLNPMSLGRLWQGDQVLTPATPAAIMFALEQAAQANNTTLPEMLAGKEALIINSSLIIGKPLAALLLAMNATVTIAHIQTKDLPGHIANADVVISGAGVPGLITAAAIKPGAIVIDAGFKKTETGTQGDIGLNDLSAKASCVSPVPNGIGPLGVAFLISNTVTAAGLSI